MKKSKIISLTVVLLLLFSLSSCSIDVGYEYMQDPQNITEIYIASLQFDEDYAIYITDEKKIEDIDAFLKDFDDLACYEYYGGPRGFEKENTNDRIIKLVYSNGDYELIGWHGMAKYTTSDDRLRNYRGHRVFDEVPFKEFTQKYSN